MLAGGLLTLRFIAYRILLPYQLDYEEGNILNAAVRILHGQSIYPPPSDSLYVFNPYGPVFYGAVSLIAKYFGAEFTYLRLLSVLPALLIAVLISLLLGRWASSRWLELTFGGYYLMLPVVGKWLVLLRADFPGIALSLAGLYLFSLSPQRWYRSIPLFVLALYCKYTLLAAPATCFLFLLINKELRRAAEFMGALGLLCAATFVWAQVATGGWFAFHMFSTHPDPFSLSRYFYEISVALLLQVALSVLAIVYAARALMRHELPLPLIYLALCTLAALTIGKAGSWDNHLLEWLAALCLCAGLGYYELERQPDKAGAAAFSAGALSVFAILALLVRTVPVADRTGCVGAYAYVKSHPGQHILSENVGALVLANKPVLLSNPFVYTQLVRWSSLPAEPLNQLVRSRHFAVILLDGDILYLKRQATDVWSARSRWPATFVEALQENYRPVRQFVCSDANVAFEPKTTAPAPVALRDKGEDLNRSPIPLR
jgi:hypothetical protein